MFIVTEDRFFFWPCYVALGVPAGADLIDAFTSYPAGFFGAIFLLLQLLSLFCILFVSIILLCASLFYLCKLRLRSSLSCLAMPLLISFLILRPLTAIPSVAPGDYLHYFIFRADYQAKIDASYDRQEPRFIWFYWRDASPPVFGEVLVYLVFDESDEFGLPANKRSSHWNARARRTFVEQQYPNAPQALPDKVRHLFGHYYVVRLDY
jgi:hypothetical protein